MENCLLSVNLEKRPTSLGINFIAVSDKIHRILKKPGKHHTVMDSVDFDKKNELLEFFFQEIAKHAKYFKVYFHMGLSCNKIRVVIYKPHKYEDKIREDITVLKYRAQKRNHQLIILDKTRDWHDALCTQRNLNNVYPLSSPFKIDKEYFGGDEEDFYYRVYCQVDSI